MEGSPVVRVLWIEDDETDYILTRSALANAQQGRFEPTWVTTYAAGLEALVGGRYDICLLDNQLGAHEGLELLREARARHIQTPIILLIGPDDDPAIVAQVARAEAADYLIKGQISASLLERSIRYAIERAQLLEALRISEERYALAARGAHGGLWDWDILGQQVFFSPRWKAVLGYADQEIGASFEEMFSLVHPEDIGRLEQAIADHLAQKTPYLEIECRVRHKDGGYRWMLVHGIALWDADGRAYRLGGSQTDITARKNAEAHLERSVLYDALTGLPNRALLMDRMRRALERAKRHAEYQYAVLFLDFDRFKVVNDSLGHMIGDQLLVEIARRLEACMRAEDTVARLGGDEFVVLADYIGEVGDAVQIAERIQRAMAAPFDLGGHEVFTSVSVGIAMSISGYDQPETILRDADTAMNRAKSSGRARYQLFDGEMHARAVALLRLETDLRRALERDEFEIYYQPIVALENDTIIGFEALVRWRHPQRGIVRPGEFVPIAEETGLIALIDWWVLRTACRQLAIWQRQYPADPPLSMSVNLSSRDFSRPDLVERILQELHDAGLAGHSLRLEITESALMEHTESAAAMLERLRALDVQVYIDDFGTGYSSLSYLHRFPVDTLKIDRLFVSRMGAGGENARIVQTILSLARDLGMHVIAEGVETSEQCDHLRALRCEYAQGFFFSEPLSGGAIETLLKARHVGV